MHFSQLLTRAKMMLAAFDTAKCKVEYPGKAHSRAEPPHMQLHHPVSTQLYQQLIHMDVLRDLWICLKAFITLHFDFTLAFFFFFFFSFLFVHTLNLIEQLQGYYKYLFSHPFGFYHFAFPSRIYENFCSPSLTRI
jgi:hypothetical protein